METKDVLTLLGILVSIVALIPLYLDYFRRRKESWSNLLIKPFKEPGFSEWRLNIRNLTNTSIEECSIYINDIQLQWTNKDESYSKIIMAPGEAGNVVIPKSIPLEKGYIIVKNGKTELKKVKLESYTF